MLNILDQPIPCYGGIKLPTYKQRSLGQSLESPKIPKRLTLPLRQHIGKQAVPIVNIGAHVLKGQVIAEAQSAMSAPIHASSSGVIADIGDYLLPNPSGTKGKCIVIETDGEDKSVVFDEKYPDYTHLDPVVIQQHIFKSGIVGLGGAGFPSAIKLIPSLNLDIELLIINAAECEPYISCDEMNMRHRTAALIEGIKVLIYATQVSNCVLAIEDNKTETIEILRSALKAHDAHDIQLKLLPSVYPIGGEKQLIKSLTGMDVPSQGLPIDIGVICYNVGTVIAVKQAVIDGIPLIERTVTMSGDAMDSPRNLQVLIGTPIADLISQYVNAGMRDSNLIMGGPMMGFELHDAHVPITKISNSILLMKLAEPSTELSCIGCDQCVRVCPVKLQPQQLYWKSIERDIEALYEYHLFDCIECGCCAYVCPSHIPLVQYYQRSKAHIWDSRQRDLQASQNKKNYLVKQQRLQQEKTEQKESAHEHKNKKRLIEQAVLRERQRRGSISKD